MTYKFDKKFSEKNIDKFINEFYTNYLNNPDDNYIFDLTELEWVSNQELLVFSGLIKYLYEKHIVFELHFYKKGIPTYEIPIRVKKQIIQFWDVWKIWKIIPLSEHQKYFGIDGYFVENIKKSIKYNPNSIEIYNRYGITPFICLENINNYEDKKIENTLASIYKLNEATDEILAKNNCKHPFTSDTLSLIITKEFYENFLDHFKNSFFRTKNNWAFMSLSMIEKLNDNIEKLDYILENNFKQEAIPEAIDFFLDKLTNKYKNQSYIQFSFMDFGIGISKTLEDQYLKKNDTEKSLFSKNKDSEILKFAFNFDSSRHPIKEISDEETFNLSRGLFDVLSIVKRYKGLITVRSNEGKILYDFSKTLDIETAFKKFGDKGMNFPGTLISIFLPAIEKNNDFDNTVIKPNYKIPKSYNNEKVYINLYEIIKKIKSNPKKNLYTDLLSQLKENIINKNQTKKTIFLNFSGYDEDKRLTKKALNFLLTDYNINLNNNVIILNPPSIEFLNEVKIEIENLNSVIKDYIIHPLPFIFNDFIKDEITLYWLGIYDKQDAVKLNELLFEQTSIVKADFNVPNNIIGNINYFDENTNLISNLPNEEDLKKEIKIIDEILISNLIKIGKCIKENDDKSIYLCNGNYYQNDFLELIHILNDIEECDFLASLLYKKLKKQLNQNQKYKFVGITSSSHKIINSLIKNKYIESQSSILFDNYHTFLEDDKFNSIEKNDKIILICDVIATGVLTSRLIEKLNDKNAELCYVSVLVDTIDEDFETSKKFNKNHADKIISLYSHKIKKFRRTKENKSFFVDKKIIRINPFTNIPITLSINETNYFESVLLNSKIKFNSENNLIEIDNAFLDQINYDYIKLGYLKFNNVIHPYFFDTNKILKNIDKDLLKSIFDMTKISGENLQIFYPKNSGIDNLNFDLISDYIFKNHLIKYFELERFGTKEGWKFPHTIDYLSKINNSNTILILDDGSCTGDSIMQMIDEIAFLELKEIIVLCFIGRVNDHKREFFSRITNIKTNGKLPVPISIYFASHWHIPTYYLDENPNTNEKTWLEDLISLQNTPIQIKSIAERVLSEIEPKSTNTFKDYKYLPKEKNTGNIPKRDLLKIRDEIGKIIGYRFYKESFSFFNVFMKKYENNNTLNRYKEIELLCATIIYEPYLYEKIKEIVPDIIEKIESFVRILIFGNPSSKIEKIDLENDLFYSWDKKDIVHLFFIVFKNEKLLNELKDNKILQLIKFTDPKESALSYVLYKLLRYFPLTKKELSTKNCTSEIKTLLDSILLLDSSHINLNLIKQFNSFHLTLPSNEDYSTSLLRIQNEIKKIISGKFHNDNVNYYIDTISIKLEYLSNVYAKIVVNEVEENWQKTSRIIEYIISFKNNFPEFFKILSIDEKFKIENLTLIHRDISNLIYKLKEDSSFLELDELITTKIKPYFQEDSSFHKIFGKIQCNVDSSISNFVKDLTLKNTYSLINYRENKNNRIVSIPDFIFNNIILFEILENFRHCDYEKNIEIIINDYEDKSIDLIIINSCKEKTEKGNGHGLEKLELLNDFPNNIIKYEYNIEDNKFKQKIKIKHN